MSLTIADIENLSPEEKRALLVQLLQKEAGEPEGKDPVVENSPGVLDGLAISVSDLAPEAVLDPAIRPDAAAPAVFAAPDNILLTGATGFLGAFLLAELLRQTTADVYCLVRAADRDKGLKRIWDNLVAYRLERDARKSRVIPVLGDMSRPRLGLTERQFSDLAGKADAIYHSGAWVNWIYPYQRLKPANVLGTQEILRLACWEKIKPLHYVSTISVFPMFNDAEAGTIYEGDSLDHGAVLYGGYMQSKWVAEKLATEARDRGLPVAIYRPGLITGDGRSGAWNSNDVTSKLVKSFVILGSAPDLDAATDMTPVDYVGQAIVHLSSLPNSLGKVFHLTNPKAVYARDLIGWIQAFGYPIEAVPYERWKDRLVRRARQSRDDVANTLAPLFTLQVPEDEPLAKTLKEQTTDGLGVLFVSQYARMKMCFDCQNALAGLAGTAIRCPPVDGALFTSYLSHFVRSGFLEAPPDDRLPAAG